MATGAHCEGGGRHKVVVNMSANASILPANRVVEKAITVKTPNKGHIGDGPFVHCREVVLFSEVFVLNLLEIS